ncbi:hypothetical protein [Microbacterium sp. KR10-403]|uniref:hypothetical protein n=1 Tax=Microbacterium sp. KR10-403 TaxID=3158581 RepID=UPI0032E4ACCF
MAPTITAPESFTGVRSGIEFTDGVAEVDSLDDAAREVFAAHGFTVEGENGPTAEEREAAERAEAERLAAEAKAEADRAAAEKAEAEKAAKAKK